MTAYSRLAARGERLMGVALNDGRARFAWRPPDVPSGQQMLTRAHVWAWWGLICGKTVKDVSVTNDLPPYVSVCRACLHRIGAAGVWPCD